VSETSTEKHVHLLGICGTAMGAFAGMLQAKGFQVTGSDVNTYPPMSTQLKELGIPLYAGFQASNLDKRPDLVIVGNVIRRDNPEALAMVERGIPYMSMPAAVAEFFIMENHSLVVTGTHGKTTTSSALAWCLEKAGHTPGFLVGGELNNFARNYQIGDPGYFVIEGDEYDTAYFDKGPKFLHYRPKSAILTSIEFDHADIYRDLAHVKDSFRDFVELLPTDGLLVACTDYEHVRDLLPATRAKAITYGLEGDCDYSGYVEDAGPEGMRFVVTKGGGPIFNFQTSMVGKHNLLNLIATTVLLKHLGMPIETIAEGIETFRGVKRRQEVIADVWGITIIDDFAHHPTAVQSTIEAVRMRYPGQRLWAIFEPRSATSRRNVFQDRFVAAFTSADRVIIADVFNAYQIDPEERFSPKQVVEALQGRGVEASTYPNADAIVDFITLDAQQGDVILVMSNGGFDGIYQKLRDALSERTTLMPFGT